MKSLASNIDDLSNEIARNLRQYTEAVEEEIQIAQKDVAKKAVKKLKSAGTFENQSGDYRKGWRTKKVGNKQIVHNATNYQLTHLLEKGHVIKNGTGRSFGRTRTFEHIEPVERKVIEEFTERVERAIKR